MTPMSRRLLVLCLAAFLIVGACSSKKKTVGLNAAHGGTTTTTSTDPGAPAAGGGPAGGAAASGTGSAGGAAAGSAPKPGAGGSTTTAKPAGGGTTASGQAGSSAVGAKPGTYTFALSGTGPFGPVSGNQDDVVDPAAGPDQHTSTKDANGNTAGESVLHFQADGVYLKDLKLAAGISKEFKFNPLALVLAQPPADGKTWAWGPYKSTDDKTTINSSFKIIGLENIAVGSEQAACIHLQVTVTTTGDIATTSTQDIWASTKSQMTVQEHDKVDGTATIGDPPTTYPVHSDTTRKLTTTTPR